jgi:hypothetical protein
MTPTQKVYPVVFRGTPSLREIELRVPQEHFLRVKKIEKIIIIIIIIIISSSSSSST